MSNIRFNQNWIDSFRIAYRSLLDEGMSDKQTMNEAIVFADYSCGLISTRLHEVHEAHEADAPEGWITAYQPAKKTKAKNVKSKGKIIYHTGKKKFPNFKRISLVESSLKKDKTAMKSIGRKWICNFKVKSYSCGKQKNTYDEIKEHFGFTTAPTSKTLETYVQQQCRLCNNRRVRDVLAPRKRAGKVDTTKINHRARKNSVLYPADKDFPYQQKCSNCKTTTAKGHDEVKEKFGFTRTKSKGYRSFRIVYSNGVIAQNWCRKCRLEALLTRRVQRTKRNKRVLSPNRPKCAYYACNEPAKKDGIDSSGNQRYRKYCKPNQGGCYEKRIEDSKFLNSADGKRYDVAKMIKPSGQFIHAEANKPELTFSVGKKEINIPDCNIQRAGFGDDSNGRTPRHWLVSLSEAKEGQYAVNFNMFRGYLVQNGDQSTINFRHLPIPSYRLKSKSKKNQIQVCLDEMGKKSKRGCAK